MSAPDMIRSSAAAMAAKLAAGEITSVELVQAHLDRIAEVDGGERGVHAFLHVNGEEALAVAADVDARRAAGEELHELAGVPIAIKDLIVTKGQPTTAASKILEGWMSPYDATVIERIRAARMPMLGKTNLDEFAMGSSTEHSAYGPTRNPWDLDRIPGGSGGGSAAAVAAFEAPPPTPAAPSASPDPSPAPSASSPHTVPFRATAPSPWRPHWTRSAPSHAPCLTQPCCRKSSAATTRRTRRP